MDRQIVGFFLTTPCYIDTGANASAEEADDGVDDGVQKVNNILHTFNLKPTQFDKKSYGLYLKGALLPSTQSAVG